MVLPYQRLSVIGDGAILCGAKGTSIYTFDIESHTLLSSWSHPLSRKVEGQKVSVDDSGEPGRQESEQSEQPPSKKRKLGSNGEDKTEDQETEVPTENLGSTANGKGKGKKQKAKQVNPRPQEQPFIVLITATSNGSHVIAVTGQDKTIWVLEHDGKGGLKELSQRAMPKRPSAITLTSDEKTILCADKFGDAYSIPLIPSIPTTSGASTPMSTPAPRPEKTRKGANKLTVHSLRNLKALEHQEQTRNSNPPTPKEGLSFEHELIIGHVSMLTAMIKATREGKSYILTADRDEHIRVSRGIPQTHIIHSFCLGHKAFITALCMPVSQSELLISGGGDNELFVWDWLAGKLLNKVGLLPYVQEIVVDAQKIAVSGLYQYHTERGSNIVVICERVQSILVFELRGNTLIHAQTLRLTGNPLDIAMFKAEGQTLKLIVAVDPVPGTSDDQMDPSLLTLDVDNSGRVSTPNALFPTVEAADQDVPRDELEKILYAVESLRKTEFEDSDDDEQTPKASASGQGESGTDSMDVSEAA